MLKKFFIFLILFVFLIFFSKFLIFKSKAIGVEVYKVQRGTIEEIVTNTRAGTLKARLKSKLSPKTAGLVVSINKRKGEFAQKGDLLLKIDSSIQRAKLEAIKKQVEAFKAKYSEAKTIYELSKKDEERILELFKSNIVSEDLYDKAKAERERAESILNSSIALLKQAEAELKLVEEEYKLTELYAPFDGYISELYTEIGEWITPSPPGIYLPPVMEIINTEELYVSAPIDEMDSKKVNLGDEVRVTIDSFPKKVFQGKISKIGVYVQDILEQNRTVEVEVDLKLDKDLNPLPGTSADVEIIVSKKENVLKVPTTAIFSDGTLFVLKDGKIQRKSVKTGIQNWAFTEVLEGLMEGELVLKSHENTEIKEGVLAYPLNYD